MIGYPGELVADLVARDKARQRLVSLTKQLGDVELAGADPTSRLAVPKVGPRDDCGSLEARTLPARQGRRAPPTVLEETA